MLTILPILRIPYNRSGPASQVRNWTRWWPCKRSRELMQDPSQNPIRLPNVGDVASNLVKLGVDMITDFNPFITGSFLFWGAPTLYSVPAALAGLVQNFTGIPNQFVGIGAVARESTAGGGIPPGAENAGPLDLLTRPARWGSRTWRRVYSGT